MKKFKKLLSALLVFLSITILNPVQANATWKSDSNGWWYTEGNSYAIGWTKISGQWYYFDNNGYMKTGWLQDGGNWYYFYGEGAMAHDTTIDGCYLNNSGAWTTSIPTQNTTAYNANSNSGTSSYSGGTQYVDANGNGLIKGSKSHIYHVPGSTYYNKTTNVTQWFKTVEEAEAAGYRSPEK